MKIQKTGVTVLMVFILLGSLFFIQGLGCQQASEPEVEEPEEPGTGIPNIESFDYRLRSAHTSCMIYCEDYDRTLCDSEIIKQVSLKYRVCSLTALGTFCYCVQDTSKTTPTCQKELNDILERFCEKEL